VIAFWALIGALGRWWCAECDAPQTGARRADGTIFARVLCNIGVTMEARKEGFGGAATWFCGTFVRLSYDYLEAAKGSKTGRQAVALGVG